MKHAALTNYQNPGFFVLLVAFCCLPVWAVEYFINQDGSAHLYSAHIMLQILKGDPAFSETFALNSLAVPNSTGHWLMTLLLNFVSPFVVTKIIVTLTFAGLIAASWWLRLRTVDTEGVKTAMLVGAAIGFNWLWLCGFYNFLIGVSCLVFSIGLFYPWRDKMNLRRTVILSLLILTAYFSHIISFLVLTGSVFLMLVTADKKSVKRNLLYFFAALLPVLPLIIIYKSVSAGGGGFFPVWRNLENVFSPVSWLMQLRTADPFILISRRSFPLTNGNSAYFAIFTPILWISAAFLALAAATYFVKDQTGLFSGKNLVFGFLFLIAVFAALLAPDDFGLNNGSILRERLLICGLLFFIPLFDSENAPRLKKTAQLCLAVVIIFQTAALWDYARRTDRDAREFLSAQSAVSKADRTVSIVFVDENLQFNSTPLAMMNNNLGVIKNQIVWDNYEIGHYLFPVIARNSADKVFVLQLTQNNAFAMRRDNSNFEEKLARLETLVAQHHEKIDKLIIWGGNARLENFLLNWFAPQPVFENKRVRVFRHKP